MEAQKETALKALGMETRQIQRLGLYGFLLNVILAGIKGALALKSGSLALTASAMDSATDAVASLVLYIGLKLSARKTRKFPLGLYKIENVLSIIVAFFIFFAGYEMVRHLFFSPTDTKPDISIGVILMMVAATAAPFFFGQYAISVGRRTESPTLMAEGRHRQADVLSSCVVLISLLITAFDIDFNFHGFSIDHMAAAVVLVFIGHTGWKLLSDGMRVLLDASIDHGTLSQVRRIMEAEPMVAGVQSLVGRSAGRFRFLEASLMMRTEDLSKAHQIGRKIESRIHEQVPHVERVVIHYQPMVREDLWIAVPLSDETSSLSPHFGDAPFFSFLRVRFPNGEITVRKVEKNPCRTIERGKGIRVAEWLIQNNVDRVLLTASIRNKGPTYALSDAGVRIVVVSADTLEEAIRSMLEKEQQRSPGGSMGQRNQHGSSLSR